MGARKLAPDRNKGLEIFDQTSSQLGIFALRMAEKLLQGHYSPIGFHGQSLFPVVHPACRRIKTEHLDWKLGHILGGLLLH